MTPYLRGVRLSINHHDYEAALPHFLEHAEKWPDDAARALVMSSRCCSNLASKHSGFRHRKKRKEYLERGESYARRAMDADPERPDVYSELASFVRERDSEEAERLRNRAFNMEVAMGVYPPRENTGPESWVAYWNYQTVHHPYVFRLEHRLPDLIRIFREREVRTILLAGNGILQDPTVFAAAGFEVTALDFSPIATNFAAAYELDEERLLFYLEGTPVDDPVPVQWITGDIFDSKACPGPYDVVMERCLSHGFKGERRIEAVESLVQRLSSKGFLVQHLHGSNMYETERLALDIADRHGFTIHRWGRSDSLGYRALGWFCSSG